MTSGTSQRAQAAPSGYQRFMDGSLLGLVAYGTYESLKHEWVASETARLGYPPTQAQIEQHISTVTAGVEKQIRQSAADTLKVYAAEAVRSEALNVLRELRPAETFWPRFWRDVGVGVVAALFWTLLLIGVGFLVTYAKPDVFDFIDRVHDAADPGRANGSAKQGKLATPSSAAPNPAVGQ